MPSLRQSRNASRTSTPFLPPKDEPGSPAPEPSKKDREGKDVLQQASLDRWMEPALKAPTASFEDHGFHRMGVLAHMQPLGELPSAKMKFRLAGHETRRNRFDPLRRHTGSATPLLETEADVSESDALITPVVEESSRQESPDQMEEVVRATPNRPPTKESVVERPPNKANAGEYAAPPSKAIPKSTTPPYDPPPRTNFPTGTTPKSLKLGSAKRRRLSSDTIELAFDAALAKFRDLGTSEARGYVEMLTQIRQQRKQQPHTHQVLEDLLLQRQSGESYEQWVALLESAKAVVTSARRARRNAKTMRKGNEVKSITPRKNNRRASQRHNSQNNNSPHAYSTRADNRVLASTPKNSKAPRPSAITSSSRNFSSLHSNLHSQPKTFSSPPSAPYSLRSSPSSQLHAEHSSQSPQEAMVQTRASARRAAAAASAPPEVAQTSVAQTSAAQASVASQTSQAAQQLPQTSQHPHLSQQAPVTQPSSVSQQSEDQTQAQASQQVQAMQLPAPVEHAGSSAASKPVSKSRRRKPAAAQAATVTTAAGETAIKPSATSSIIPSEAPNSSANGAIPANPKPARKPDSEETLSEVDESIIRNGDKNKKRLTSVVSGGKPQTNNTKLANGKRNATSAALSAHGGRKPSKKEHKETDENPFYDRLWPDDPESLAEEELLEAEYREKVKNEFSLATGPYVEPLRTTGPPSLSKGASAAKEAAAPGVKVTLKLRLNAGKKTSSEGGDASRQSSSAESLDARSEPVPPKGGDAAPGAAKKKRSWDSEGAEGTENVPKKAKTTDTREVSSRSPSTPLAAPAMLRVKESPNKPNWAGETHPAGVRPSRQVRANQATDTIDNYPIGADGSMDQCVVCGQVGDLVVCDKCPRAFHFVCVDPPIVTDRSSIESQSFSFFCDKCKEVEEVEGMDPMIDPFLEAMERMNPMVFSLPKEIKTMFVGVSEGPNGQYSHILDKQAAANNNKKRPAATRSRSRRGVNTSSEDDAQVDSALAGIDFCSYCGKSNYDTSTLSVDNTGIRQIVQCSVEGCNEKFHAYHKVQTFPLPMLAPIDTRYATICNKHLGFHIEVTRHPGRMTGPEESILNVQQAVAWHPVRTMKQTEELEVDQSNRHIRNNGIIDITLDDDRAEGTQVVSQPDGAKARLPENFITMDFITKNKKRKFEETLEASFKARIDNDFDRTVKEYVEAKYPDMDAVIDERLQEKYPNLETAVDTRLKEMFPDYATAIDTRVRRLKTELQTKVDAEWDARVEKRYQEIEVEMTDVFKGALEKDSRFQKAVERRLNETFEKRVAEEVAKKTKKLEDCIERISNIPSHQEQLVVFALAGLGRVDVSHLLEEK